MAKAAGKGVKVVVPGVVPIWGGWRDAGDAVEAGEEWVSGAQVGGETDLGGCCWGGYRGGGEIGGGARAGVGGFEGVDRSGLNHQWVCASNAEHAVQ